MAKSKRDCEKCKNHEAHYMLISTGTFTGRNEEIFHSSMLPSVKQNQGQVNCQLG